MRRSREYDREFIGLMCGLDKTLFGQRGSCGFGVDVLLYQSFNTSIGGKTALVWRFEVKTSVEDPFALRRDKDRKQLRVYRDLFKSHSIPTFYAFRLIGGRDKETDARWRIYDAEDLPENKNGNPVLTLEGDDGWTLAEFCETVINPGE